MKIVVTGSSGGLGSAVVRDLLSAGHEVLPIDVRPPDQGPGVETRCLNLTDVSALTELFDRADAVCHLGNLPMLPTPPTTAGFINNVGSTHAVFEAALAARVSRIINASSLQAYGVLRSPGRATLPVSTPRYFPIDEDHPLLPTDAYPLSKAMGEQIAQAYCRQNDRLAAVSMRFTAIRLDKPARPSRFDRLKFALGGSLCSAVLVTDAARACRLACERELSPGHTALNIVSPQVICPWNESALRDLYGSVPEFREAVRHDESLVSWRRAEQFLGFRAGPIFRDGDISEPV